MVGLKGRALLISMRKFEQESTGLKIDVQERMTSQEWHLLRLSRRAKEEFID